MIPGIVRKRDLRVANSLFTFTFNGAFLVGFTNGTFPGLINHGATDAFVTKVV